MIIFRICWHELQARASWGNGWVQYVAGKLEDAGKLDMADMVQDNFNIIQKYVSSVDKATGEINFLKLDNY